MVKKDALVIGLGISGCAAARLLAESGYSVTCFEADSHIGGSLFEDVRPNGIRVQTRGPQIFHTDSENTYQFIKRFGSFFPYRHRVFLSCQNKLGPLPLNANSLTALFGVKQAEALLSRISSAFPDERRISVDRLIDCHDAKLIDLGRFMIENILTLDINHKEGSSFAPADDSYMNDAYVDIGSDDCYYTDSIQAMPMQGFMSVMEHMIDHPAINVYLNTNALSRISIHQDESTVLLDGVPFHGPIIYTPALDKLFKFCYGALPYREGRVSFKDIKTDFQNDCAVILSPKDKETIRISESKYMTLQNIEGHTTLCLESPYVSASRGNIEPFEPAISEESLKLYGKYADLVKSCPSIHPLGRIACFRNLSIAESIEQAIEVISRF
ncbi:MAG: NAD(P)-binding protein [Clostridiales bacterium]|nr:NAD(P)-binding protein [Clostridiales bacterium]